MFRASKRSSVCKGGITVKKEAVKKRVRNYTISLCGSYTLLNVILSLLNQDSALFNGGWGANLQMFVVCLAIAVLMFITESIRNPDGMKTQITVCEIGIDLIDVAVPVLGLGGPVFHWFELFSFQIIYPICIMIFVYAVIFVLFYINSKQTEKELNRKINERKEVLRNG